MYAITQTSYRAISDGAPLAAGETAAEQVPVGVLDQVKGEQVKLERTQRLRDTDWTQMADAPLTAAQKTAMGAYRQALRDLPGKPGFPDVAWPVPPALDGAASGVDPVLIP